MQKCWKMKKICKKASVPCEFLRKEKVLHASFIWKDHHPSTKEWSNLFCGRTTIPARKSDPISSVEGPPSQHERVIQSLLWKDYHPSTREWSNLFCERTTIPARGNDAISSVEGPPSQHEEVMQSLINYFCLFSIIFYCFKIDLDKQKRLYWKQIKGFADSQLHQIACLSSIPTSQSTTPTCVWCNQFKTSPQCV